MQRENMPHKICLVSHNTNFYHRYLVSELLDIPGKMKIL